MLIDYQKNVKETSPTEQLEQLLFETEVSRLKSKRDIANLEQKLKNI